MGNVDHPDRYPTAPQGLRELLGDVDVYLFDQVMKGRFPAGARILDVGCGGGRNVVWFLRAGYDVHAIDPEPRAVQKVRRMAAELAPSPLPNENFRVETAEETSFPDASFDAVIASAVLHMARDRTHFDGMLAGCWRVVRPGGLLFARLAASDGIRDRLVPRPGGRWLLPDGGERFLVDQAELLALTGRLGGTLLEPIKTTNVQGMRCMATWVLRKEP